MLKDRIVDMAWHPLQNVVVCVSGTTGQVSAGFSSAFTLTLRQSCQRLVHGRGYTRLLTHNLSDGQRCSLRSWECHVQGWLR